MMSKIQFTRRAAKAAAMTPKVAAMRQTSDGIPIPFNVMLRDDGRPVFTINDASRELLAVADGLCGVTGSPLEVGDVWMLCGPQSAFDARGVVNDAPVCGEAKDYALTVCPYFAMPKFMGMTKPQRKKLGAKYLSLDPTRDFNRVPYHVALKVRGFALIPTAEGMLFLPSRNYSRAELWRDGKCFEVIDSAVDIRNKIIKNMVAQKVIPSDLDVYQFAAFADRLDGVWPWQSPNITHHALQTMIATMYLKGR